jgi:acetyltransferase-like isoleucine patch superfamily enzyme
VRDRRPGDVHRLRPRRRSRSSADQVQGIYKRDVEVGSNVWIGYGACILRGVRVGDNAIVGTNSVVTKDVPANAVVAGIPAKVIRMRDAPERLRWERPVEP